MANNPQISMSVTMALLNTPEFDSHLHFSLTWQTGQTWPSQARRDEVNQVGDSLVAKRTSRCIRNCEFHVQSNCAFLHVICEPCHVLQRRVWPQKIKRIIDLAAGTNQKQSTDEATATLSKVLLNKKSCVGSKHARNRRANHPLAYSLRNDH